MSFKFRIFLFSSAIIFILTSGLTFNSYFAKVVGYQPIQFNAFKDKDLKIETHSDKESFFEYSSKTNEFIEIRDSKRFLKSNLLLDKILELRIPKVKRELFFDSIYYYFTVPKSKLTFQIDNKRFSLKILFYEKENGKILMRVLERVVVKDSYQEDYYESTIDRNSSFYQILNLINRVS